MVHEDKSLVWLTKGVPQQGQRQVTAEAIAMEQQLEHRAPPWNTNGFAQPFQRPFMVFLIKQFNSHCIAWFIMTNSLVLFILLAMIITRTKWSWNMVVKNEPSPPVSSGPIQVICVLCVTMFLWYTLDHLHLDIHNTKLISIYEFAFQQREQCPYRPLFGLFGNLF